MKTYTIRRNSGDEMTCSLVLEETAAPGRPGRGEVRLRIHASSLNYRDLLILKGGYPRNDNFPTVPLSDGAGEILEIGEDVAGFTVGDRVANNFMRDWESGPATEAALTSGYGGGIDGVLREEMLIPASALVKIPDHLDYEEAATLPCAGVTAWNGLVEIGAKSGETVLVLGTGGVAIFALQFAKAMGLQVIITSSSDEKLARARSLGADQTINYRTRPDWDAAAREQTGGRGVDLVIENGGSGTYARSLSALAVGGRVSLIGVLAQSEENPSPTVLLINRIRAQGIYVGSTQDFREMNAFISKHSLRPVIDRSFNFNEAPAAFEALGRAEHLGKLVIRH